MKTKIALLILALTCNARATLIELTPGGFIVNNAPPAFFEFLRQWSRHQFDFFDSATPEGWVSLYGILDGGVYFQTSLIGHPGQSTTVNWNFTNLPGWSMTRILVEGSAEDGTAWANIYAVPRSLRELDELETVLIHEGVDILSIAFFGRWPGSPVPDGGTAAVIFGIGLMSLATLLKRVRCDPRTAKACTANCEANNWRSNGGRSHGMDLTRKR
jgi:hypothetical protein